MSSLSVLTHHLRRDAFLNSPGPLSAPLNHSIPLLPPHTAPSNSSSFPPNALHLSSSALWPSARPRTGPEGECLETTEEEDDDDDEDEEIDWAKDPNSNHFYHRFGDMENEEIIHSGYLDKKGERRKTWKRRWFVLRKTSLVYYKNEKEYRLLRMLPLSDIHTCAEVQVKHHDNTFGIVTSTRTFYVRSASRSERDHWTLKVNQAKDQLKLHHSRLNPSPKSRSGDDHPVRSPQDSVVPGILRSHTIIGNVIGSSMLAPVASHSNAGEGPSRQPVPLATWAASPPRGRGLTTPCAMYSPRAPSSSGLSDQLNNQATLSRSSAWKINSHLALLPTPEPPPSESASLPLATIATLSSAGSSAGVQEFGPSSLPQHSQIPALQVSSSEDDDDCEEEIFSGVHPIGGIPQPITQPTPHTRAQPAASQSPRERIISLPEAGKTITQGYLMKQGKRKTWRKRYFLLTSQKLVYSKSHMSAAGKNSRSIPIGRILDAIEFQSPDEHPTLTGGSSSLHQVQQHCLKIITSDRTYLVNAPTEEDEIRWISAIRCLLASYRANLPKPFGGILDQPLRSIPHHGGASGDVNS